MRGEPADVIHGALSNHETHPTHIRACTTNSAGATMLANQSIARRVGRVLERVTRQSGRIPETPAYGSLLLGRVSEDQRRRRIRIQVILTVLVLGANLIGIGVALLIVTVAIPAPSVFDDAPLWLTFGVVPAYIALALAVGTYWIT